MARSLWISLAAGTALLGTGLLVGRYLVRRQRVYGPALIASFPEVAEWWKDYAKREGELLYVAIGDSTAQGIGASKPFRSYVGEIARHVAETTGKTVRVINLGVSGSTVYGAYTAQIPQLAELEPDLLTVMIGANNIAAFDPTAFEKDLKRLYAKLPDTAIVSEVPSFYFPPRETLVRVANGIVHRTAASRGFDTVVPLYHVSRRQGLWGVMTQFAGDLFHPNDRGYTAWAKAFFPTVDAALQRRDGGSV
jgi:acyl-CoA thioesterase-1